MLFQKEPGSACCSFVTVLTETPQSGRSPPQHRLAYVLRLGQSTELARGVIVISKRQYFVDILRVSAIPSHVQVRAVRKNGLTDTAHPLPFLAR